MGKHRYVKIMLLYSPITQGRGHSNVSRNCMCHTEYRDLTICIANEMGQSTFWVKEAMLRNLIDVLQTLSTFLVAGHMRWIDIHNIHEQGYEL
jgi:hypothetical protein